MDKVDELKDFLDETFPKRSDPEMDQEQILKRWKGLKTLVRELFPEKFVSGKKDDIDVLREIVHGYKFRSDLCARSRANRGIGGGFLDSIIDCAARLAKEKKLMEAQMETLAELFPNGAKKKENPDEV